MFLVNQELLEKAGEIFSERERIYWIVGGACAGKSTVARAICRGGKAELYDMDEYFFGHYVGQFSMERHPASKSWFSAENPLEWSLSLSWKAFDALYRAADVECLDLFAKDLSASERRFPLVVDGGITHPSVLVQVIPSHHIVCLEAPEDERVSLWETDHDRAEMKGWIYQLPEPDRMWQKFLYFDKMLTQTISLESQASGIPRYFRDDNCTVEELAVLVAKQFGI